MRVIDTHYLEAGPTPKEIVRLRQEILDFHLKLGQPVIFKHRWNLNDLQNGLCEECPYHDQSYERSKTDCLYCFGTGFLGGFDDGVVIFSTIADAPVDQLKISPQGYILFERHPQLTAPWNPLMGDGDLVILADFNRSTWEVLSTSDRFELNEVSPVTVRGMFGDWTDHKLFKVQQTATIDRLPAGHVYYDVPVDFDYSAAPTSIPNVGYDTDLFDYNSFVAVTMKLVGMGGFLSSSMPLTFAVVGAGTSSQKTLGLKVIAEDPATFISLDDSFELSETTATFLVLA